MHLMITNLFAAPLRSGDTVESFVSKHINSMGSEDLAHLLLVSAKSKWTWSPSHFKLIVAHLTTQPDPILPKCIGSVFYGIHTMECKSTEITILLKYLADKIDAIEGPLDFTVIGNILYGLQSMSAHHSEVRDVLTSILNKINPAGHPHTTPKAIGMCLAGLKCMDAEHVAVRRLLRRLSMALLHTECQVDSLSIGMGMFGLQHMSSNAHEVRELLVALSILISRSHVPFVATDVCIASFGLKGMSTEHPEVLKMMSVLASKLRNGVGVVQTSGIGMLLRSLQNKNGRHTESRVLLQALTDHMILHPSTTINAKVIGTGLFAFQGFNSYSNEVKRFLEIFAMKVNEYHGEIFVRDVANALYGLRLMDSRHPEVRLVITALTTKLKRCEDALVKPGEISMALFGLNRMNADYQEIRDLLKTLLHSMTREDHSVSVFTAEQAAKCISGLYQMSSEHDEVRQLVALLAQRLQVVDGRMSIKDVRRCMHGLTRLSSDHKEVLQLVKVINSHVQEAFAPRGEEGSGGIELDWLAMNSLAGMNSLESSHPEVEALVHTFIRPIERLKCVLHSRNIVAALWGLKRMSSEQYYVRGLMVCLADKLYAAKGDFTEADIRKCMVALNNKASHHREVRDLVEVLAVKVREAEGVRLSSTYVGDTISNLPGLNADNAAIKNLVKSLYVKCVLPSLKSG